MTIETLGLYEEIYGVIIPYNDGHSHLGSLIVNLEKGCMDGPRARCGTLKPGRMEFVPGNQADITCPVCLREN